MLPDRMELMADIDSEGLYDASRSREEFVTPYQAIQWSFEQAPSLWRVRDLISAKDKANNRNKKSGLSNSIQPDEDDIYNEIDMEDLRGPAVDTTIRLDVQEKDDEMEGDDEQVVRGIVSGKSQEVCRDLEISW